MAVIDDYLDMMDDVLDKSKVCIYSPNKNVVDVNQLRHCIDDIRANLPQEIRQATTIVSDRQSIIDDAKRQADDIVRRAEARANALVANNEITKAAEQRAAELEKQAVAKSKAIKTATNDYIADMLSQTESVLAANLTQVKKMRSTVKGGTQRQPMQPMQPMQPVNPQNNQGGGMNN
ncbi:MAG: ATPase [Huintestinicola sp.]